MSTSADAQAAGDKLQVEYDRLVREIPRFTSELNSALTNPLVALIPASIVQWVIDASVNFVNVCQTILQTTWEALQGVAFPVVALVKVFDWLEAEKDSNLISEDVSPATNPDMAVGATWKGPAASAYSSAIATQSEKMAGVGDTCGKVAMSLAIVGAAGVAFYIALAVILIKLIIAIIAAIAAFGSAVFSPAGVALIVEEAAVTPAMVIAAVTALAAVIGLQVQQTAAIKSQLSSTFPSGTWPDPLASQYSDASMTDGDTSDWRLRP